MEARVLHGYGVGVEAREEYMEGGDGWGRMRLERRDESIRRLEKEATMAMKKRGK